MSAEPDLAALLGSRLCHDLIGPIGAIGNGVELLLLSRGATTDEVALLSESVTALTARLRFFRVAFGLARPEQTITRTEVKAILADLHPSGRITIDWVTTPDLPRPEVKVAFLLLLCAEQSLRGAGSVRVLRDELGWSITIASARLNPDPRLWSLIERPGTKTDLGPEEVQFALAGQAMADLCLHPDLEAGRETLRVSF